MHLISLGLENFRLFKKKIKIDFSPITLLTGPNNSGKSSAQKALLLLKDSISIPDSPALYNTMNSNSYFLNREIKDLIIPFPLKLNFSNESRHKLGGFNQLQNSKRKSIKFFIPAIFPELLPVKTGEITMEFSYRDNLNFLKSISLCVDSKIVYSFKVVHDKSNTPSITQQIDFSYILNHFLKEEINYAEKPNLNIAPDLNKKKKKSTTSKFPDLRFSFAAVSNIEDILLNLKNSENEPYATSAFTTFGSEFYLNQQLIDPTESLFSLVENPGLKKDQNLQKMKELKFLEDEFIHKTNIFNEIFERKMQGASPKPCSILVLDAFKEYIDNSLKEGISNTNFIISNKKKFWHSKEDGIPIWLSSKGKLLFGFFDRLMNFNYSLLSKSLTNLHYIPQLDLKFENLISEKDGEIYHFIANYHSLILEKQASYSSKQSLKFLNTMMKHLELGDDIDIKKIADYGYELSIISGKENIRLKDSGLGIRKLVSLMIMIASTSESYFDHKEDGYEFYNSHTIILEEPEANLHPKLQSKLADILLISSRFFNVQFIIETHSEYLIRKLQYLTAAEKNLRKGDIIIHYFNEKSLNRPPTKIEIGKDGSLTHDFGPGFYDEADNIAIDLFNMSRHRRN